MNFASVLIASISLLGAGTLAAGEGSTLTNPTKREYTDELVRLMTPAPGAAGGFVVRQDGAEVPYQVESSDGVNWVWVCADFAPGQTRRYELYAGNPAPAAPKVSLKKDGDSYILDNGRIAVKVPATAAGDAIAGPISALKLADAWVGQSAWHTALKLKKFTATVIGDGTLFAKVRLRYEFEAKAGLNQDIPVFAEIDVILGPGWGHVALFERHEMTRDDGWEFDASKGWSPTSGVGKPFSGGFGPPAPPAARALKPGGIPLARPDLYLNLFPRWNQHCKDGWAFAATDGTRHVGAVVVKASKWIWPHENSIEAIVKESGDYAGLRGSTWKGQRLWWLINSAAPIDTGYVARYAWEDLDKLNHEFIPGWPGVAKGGFASMDFYNGGQMNPTGGIRGAGRAALAAADKPGDLGTLYRVQVMMHGDAYGSYWNYWSPENPNFFTDFMKVPIALTAQLREHPQFEKLRKMAEAKVREDLYHSITLPGGAGQECPGYMSYAGSHWVEMAKLCKTHLGFDPTTWDRYKAAQYFRKRITQPDGDIRRTLPMGDTHPGKDGPRVVEVPAAEVAKFQTEELPGFGVIFNNNSGKPSETYLSFKSGPNRGHYHGDQLALHWCAQAKAVAVDHHCSYHPRAGQEHMHNRLAFSTDKFPYANMDGYERLIAFKPGKDVDIAMGQVESDRLREVTKLPPENWHQEYPQFALGKPLTYRRTVVFMKNAGRDYIVLRDQYWSPVALNATFCLHVRSDAIEHKGQTIDFGNATLFCAAPAKFEFEPFPWSHGNGGPESTQGARLGIKAERGEFITVLYPGKASAAPPMATIPNGVKVGDDEITFAGADASAGDAATYVTVKRKGTEITTLVGKDIDLDRSQGDIGLFVPDAGYPFGQIPDWLIKQRGKRPEWAK